MIGDKPEVGALVAILRRHFENDASRDEVRAEVRRACEHMHASGVPPQTMLVTLKSAVESAALDAHAAVSRDVVRDIKSSLTPWMIDVCFGPRTHRRD